MIFIVLKYWFLILFLPVIMLIGLQLPVLSQIAVAPAAICINSPSNIASLQVSNGHTSVREISVSFKFGYLSANHNGDLFMVYNDSLAEKRFGLTGNMRAFPRRFVLPPGSCQTVRIQVRNMKDKPDGVYWSRVILSSRQAAEEIKEINIYKGIGAKIDYVIRQSLPLFYRKGDVTVRLIPGEATFTYGDGKLTALIDLDLEGNAPFNGSVTTRLCNSSGRELAMQQQNTVVYFDMHQKIQLQLPEEYLPAGDYIVELIYETKRSDISSSDLVQTKPLHFKAPLKIQ